MAKNKEVWLWLGIFRPTTTEKHLPAASYCMYTPHWYVVFTAW